MMKHFLILLLLALPLTAMAQTKKNEISVSMGNLAQLPQHQVRQ